MSKEAIRSKARETVKKFPQLINDVLDLMEMAFDEIDDEGSEEGEYEMFCQSIEELIEDIQNED